MRVSLPLLFAVRVRDRSDGALDDFGNPIEGWSPWSEHRVYGWGAPHSSEPKTAGHDRQVVDIELMVPPEFPNVSHKGQVEMEGHIFEVVGEVEDYDHGPFGFTPGGVVNLRRVVD